MKAQRAGRLASPPSRALLTVPVSHAVEEHPVLFLWSILHKGDVVTCLYAEHCEKLHLLPRDSWAAHVASALKLLRDMQFCRPVRFAQVVRMSLGADNRGRQQVSRATTTLYTPKRKGKGLCPLMGCQSVTNSF